MSALEKLDRSEAVLLFGILKDACRERLEKNLLNQAFEERLAQRGSVPGRVDPRPNLKRWEPKYRKLLEVATELQAALRNAEVETITEVFETYAEQRRPAARVVPITRRRVETAS